MWLCPVVSSHTRTTRTPSVHTVISLPGNVWLCPATFALHETPSVHTVISLPGNVWLCPATFALHETPSVHTVLSLPGNMWLRPVVSSHTHTTQNS